MSSRAIPMSSPDITTAEIEAVSRVLATRYLSIGPQMEAFEQGLASYVGTRYAAVMGEGLLTEPVSVTFSFASANHTDEAA